MLDSQSLRAIIIDRIDRSPDRRITFAEYMDLVLYHPEYGYYGSGKAKIGSQGDFFTSSSLGSDFGELLAEQFVEMWEILGKPDSFTLVEVGAGSGILAADILSYLKQYYSDLFTALDYIIIERSQGAIARQKDLLQSWQTAEHKICWKSWEELADNSIVGCIVSNELIDALPVHSITIKDGELKEVCVTVENDKLREIVEEISCDRIADYFNLIDIKLPSSDYPDGYRSEVNLAALDWLKTVSQKLAKGYLMTIDYGYSARRYYHPQRDRGTLQCYDRHRRHHDPYLNLGCQDITTHVDFTALERQGELLGLEKLGFTQQGIFLMALGLGDRLSELSSGKFDFQQVLQRRDALHQLIDPAGLGNFGVLIQTKGLTSQEKARSLRCFSV